MRGIDPAEEDWEGHQEGANEISPYLINIDSK